MPARTRFDTGFKEPWPWDGCERREPVLDHDHNPPRVVRHVGWRICLACASAFFSQDVIKVRLCYRCKGNVSEKPLCG